MTACLASVCRYQPMLYEIDMTAKVTPVDMLVKAHDEKYNFQVHLEIRWQVRDAAEVGRLGLDVGPHLVTAAVLPVRLP